MLLRFFLYMVAVYLALRFLRALLLGASPSPPPRFRQREAPRAPPPAVEPELSAYQVLGVQPGASAEEIRKAYQRMVQQYHPDQVAHLGEELREVAERRTKAITAAYNKLKRI